MALIKLVKAKKFQNKINKHKNVQQENNMKKIFVAIALLFSATVLFAERFPMQLIDDGSHVFETTVKELNSHGIREEIVIKNKSSVPLKNVKCTLFLNDEPHEMQVVPFVEVGKTGHVKGEKDDELKDELQIFFGNAGKFSHSNTSNLKFAFSFGDANDAVKIIKISKKGKDILFEVIDK